MGVMASLFYSAGQSLIQRSTSLLGVRKFFHSGRNSRSPPLVRGLVCEHDESDENAGAAPVGITRDVDEQTAYTYSRAPATSSTGPSPPDSGAIRQQREWEKPHKRKQPAALFFPFSLFPVSSALLAAALPSTARSRLCNVRML